VELMNSNGGTRLFQLWNSTKRPYLEAGDNMRRNGRFVTFFYTIWLKIYCMQHIFQKMYCNVFSYITTHYNLLQ